MPHYDDLTPYVYVPGPEDARNVGWLAAAHPYPTFPPGEVPAGLAERLARLAARHATNATMGYQHCELCGSYDVPVEVLVDETKVPVGNAEIRVHGREHTYAAPTLVAHYVAVHDYRPPDDFVAATLHDPRAAP